MGTIYKRGSTWWMGFRDPSGKWAYESTGSKDERIARQTLSKMEEAIAQGARVATSPKTLAAYAVKWSEERQPRVWTAKKELGRLKKHVLPVLGAMKLAEIRPLHIRTLVKALREIHPPRSVRNIYGVLHRLLADAVAEELIDTTPCVLMSGDMPQIVDAKPKWREGAEFTREEVEQLISDERIPPNRRVWWAIGFLAGMRGGEIAALRWCDYDTQSRPLSKLMVTGSYNTDHKKVKATKTGKARDVPVHPTLAAILAEWKLSGWPHLNGRPPRPEDLLVTNLRGGVLAESSTKKTRPRDLRKLGLRVRRFHDARSTFITLGTVDGGEEVWLERVTHNAKGSQFNQYRRTSWPKLCEAVACLRIERLPSDVLQSPLQRGEQAMQSTETTATSECARRDSKTPHLAVVKTDVPETALAWPASGRDESEPNGGDCSDVVSPTRERLRSLMARYAAGGH